MVPASPLTISYLALGCSDCLNNLSSIDRNILFEKHNGEEGVLSRVIFYASFLESFFEQNKTSLAGVDRLYDIVFDFGYECATDLDHYSAEDILHDILLQKYQLTQESLDSIFCNHENPSHAYIMSRIIIGATKKFQSLHSLVQESLTIRYADLISHADSYASFLEDFRSKHAQQLDGFGSSYDFFTEFGAARLMSEPSITSEDIVSGWRHS